MDIIVILAKRIARLVGQTISSNAKCKLSLAVAASAHDFPLLEGLLLHLAYPRIDAADVCFDTFFDRSERTLCGHERHKIMALFVRALCAHAEVTVHVYLIIDYQLRLRAKGAALLKHQL